MPEVDNEFNERRVKTEKAYATNKPKVDAPMSKVELKLPIVDNNNKTNECDFSQCKTNIDSRFKNKHAVNN